jgi:cytochrome c peroxidase
MFRAIFRVRVLAIIFFILISFLTFSAYENPGKDDVSLRFKDYFSSRSDTLLKSILMLYDAVENKPFRIDSAKKWLRESRINYKAVEGFVNYFLPGDARVLNRAIVPELEEDDEVSGYVVPHGFQYVELLLYSDSARFHQKKIKDEVDEIYKVVSKFNESVSYMDFPERDIFESLQMSMLRQFMLDFADFDTPESKNGVVESKDFLLFMKEFLHSVFPLPTARNADAITDFNLAVDHATDYLKNVRPGNLPDYFTFYSRYYIQVSEQLGRLRDLTVSNNIYNTTAVNYQVRSVFDPGAFNSFFFLPAKQLTSRSDVIALGQTLFFDPALSANNLRACASCHQPGKGFTDGLPQSQSFEPGKMLKRNAPTIINSVLQRKLFHDGRAFTFEDQAGQVMSNPLEMHNDFSQVAIKLRNSSEYIKWFRKAFGGTEDSLISSRSILTAIAEYERSLIGMNSRFDKSISGRDNAMNDDEKTGFNIFMGKGNCGSCHFLPLFNGLLPPEYVETEWEILGVPSLNTGGKKELDNDPGRAAIISVPIFNHAFKVPSLRNVEVTSPYMHNGVFRTLEEVIEFYNNGGGRGMGLKVPFQTLNDDSLHLNSLEKFQLISFLKTLTDTTDLTTKPATLPLFEAGSPLNSRPIGGDY